MGVADITSDEISQWESSLWEYKHDGAIRLPCNYVDAHATAHAVMLADRCWAQPRNTSVAHALGLLPPQICFAMVEGFRLNPLDAAVPVLVHYYHHFDGYANNEIDTAMTSLDGNVPQHSHPWLYNGLRHPSQPRWLVVPSSRVEPMWKGGPPSDSDFTRAVLKACFFHVEGIGDTATAQPEMMVISPHLETKAQIEALIKYSYKKSQEGNGSRQELRFWANQARLLGDLKNASDFFAHKSRLSDLKVSDMGEFVMQGAQDKNTELSACLLYTSPSPRDS